jgi:uncharacterized Zn finger protein
MWGEYYGFRPYVPVAQRKANARKYAADLAKKEKRALAPVTIEGRKIARTFWGEAWNANLEAYSDFANRLPRGRTYVKNGSVIDLQIERGKVKALVAGSEVYRVTIDIATLPKAVWTQVKKDCARSIDSLLDLLAGRLDAGVMKRLSRPGDGLFPKPAEIEMRCSCPDYATMCKHCAAVLYCVGARLDTAPELLFTLRGVDQTELIGQAVAAENLDQSLGGPPENALSGDLGAMFGIDLVGSPMTPTKPKATRKKPAVKAKVPPKKSPVQKKPKPR